MAVSDAGKRAPRRRSRSVAAVSTSASMSMSAFVDAASLLRTMGLTENLRVLLLLRAGPTTVQALSRATGHSSRALTRRLSMLESRGLVELGPRQHYELSGARTRRLVDWAIRHALRSDTSPTR